MALSNKPQKSLYQIGDTVHFLNGKKMEEGTVKKVITGVTNPLADSIGVQEDIYFIGDLVQSFKEKELFHSKNALLFNLKGDWLNKFNNSDNVLIVAGSFFNECDFSYSIISEDNGLPNNFTEVNFTICKFDGCKLDGFTFSNCDLTGSSFRFVNFHSGSLENTIISYCNFCDANLTGVTLPSNANTKSTFKTVVGAGHWDPVTTIWIDGQPIGN